MWERGLKSELLWRYAGHIGGAPGVGGGVEMRLRARAGAAGLVAPYVGAWIEISTFNNYSAGAVVAPYVGAWIEMERLRVKKAGGMSLPMWERGLK